VIFQLYCAEWWNERNCFVKIGFISFCIISFRFVSIYFVSHRFRFVSVNFVSFRFGIFRFAFRFAVYRSTLGIRIFSLKIYCNVEGLVMCYHIFLMLVYMFQSYRLVNSWEEKKFNLILWFRVLKKKFAICATKKKYSNSRVINTISFI
jgi:hypothetical protein